MQEKQELIREVKILTWLIWLKVYDKYQKFNTCINCQIEM